MALKRILVKGTPLRDEGEAAAAVTPGYLVEEVAGGIQPHGTAAGTAAPMFALERAMTGDDIDTDYAENDTVLLAVCRPGDQINALVAASAPAIAVGDKLESAGDGTLRKVVASAATDEASRESVVAEATEAVDNSAGGTEARIVVRVL